MAHVLGAIDWDAPWLAPYRGIGESIVRRVEGGATVADALDATHTRQGCQSRTCPVHFVPQSVLPPGMAYEAFIYESRQVPTRDGLHDFFNGLCWLHFPHIKSRLNQLQAEQIAHSGIQSVRGVARDALTVLDENAAFFVGPDAVWDALAGKDWSALFGPLRPAWADVQLVLFGHALLEKLVYPRKPVTAHVFRAFVATNSIADLDVKVAADLSTEQLATKPFAHLPVLGVPGWWSANAAPDFYADRTVFRAPKRSASGL